MDIVRLEFAQDVGLLKGFDMGDYMENILFILGRKEDMFAQDVSRFEQQLSSLVKEGSFLVIGGAGSIGQAVTKEIFQRNPARLHVIDISENNLVELVRDIRSSLGYIDGDFQTLALDCGGLEFNAFLRAQEPYDYVLNLSALKHVRSEKDPYTLMRMISANVLNTEELLQYAVGSNCRKYFAVSTDKAVNPVNAMGATKSVMEMCMMRASQWIPVSTARFANVAFSDGSLLHGFGQRIAKSQPISAPQDVKRYFVTAKEAGELCMMSALLGENRELFFPKLSEQFQMIDFATIATRYLENLGYEPYICEAEDEARRLVEELLPKKLWPCYFFNSDTTGEKSYEEFYTKTETVDIERFAAIGVVKTFEFVDDGRLERFLNGIRSLRQSGQWTKEDLMEPLRELLCNFHHKETHKYLDSKM